MQVIHFQMHLMTPQHLIVFSNTVNSNRFVNTIAINFQETLSLEAFLYDTAYSTNNTATPNTCAFWDTPHQ